jgi:L-aminopeptidase/D-esterase-like protein
MSVPSAGSSWVPGVAVGHWDDPRARTGTTVVLLPEGTVASGEVRGGAPGTREWALLDPTATVDRVDAVVLTGGSAFGLAACDGVVGWCAEHGRGWPTPAGPVPIVVGMVLYDLGVGDPGAHPGPAEGAAACASAAPGRPPSGSVGAGTGATIGTWRGGPARPGGLGVAALIDGPVTVAAVVAVNALGDLRTPDSADPELPPAPPPGAPAAGAGTNTTIGVVLTDAALSKVQCQVLARAAHDGLARALEPAHSPYDGDAFVAVPGEEGVPGRE